MAPAEFFLFQVLPAVSALTLGLGTLRYLVIAILNLFGAFDPEWHESTLLSPWRPFFRRLLSGRRWFEKHFQFGKSARSHWTGLRAAMTLSYKPPDLFLGTVSAWGLPTYQYVGLETERHAVMIAAAGTGKSVHAISQLALHPGTVFVIDVKGQAAKVAGPADPRSRALAPYAPVPGVQSVSWNALDELTAAEARHGPDAVVRYSAIIAEGLIRTDPGERQKHFPDSAREFVQGLILHVYTTEPPHQRNLLRVRELLTQGYPQAAPDGFDFLLEEMQRNAAYGGLIVARAAAIAQTGDNERGGILSTARLQTAWLDYPELKAISKHSDFELADLKTGDLRLYVVAPAADLRGPISGWARLLTSMTFYTFESIPGRLDVPCLCLIDEAMNLGYLSALEKAAPLLRGAGVRLQVIAQSLDQIKAVYPNSWENFISSAEAVFWMGTNGMATAEYITRTLGRRTRKEKLDGGLLSRQPTRHHKVERELLDPDQVKRYLDKGGMVVTRFGRAPLRLRKAPYFSTLPVWRYEPDPDFSESPFRAFTRRLLAGGSAPSSAAGPPGANSGSASSAPQAGAQHNRQAASGSRSPAKPIGRPSTITYSDALSIFGLQEPYSASEVHQRYPHLQAAAKRHRAYATAVQEARDVLLRRAA